MRWSPLLLLLIIAAPLAAQETCAAQLRAAYASTALECAELAPGEVCYGSGPLEIAALDSGQFDRPGDRVTGLQSLDSGATGVAMLRVEANHPEEIVTMLVLGELTLENASEAEQPVIVLPVRVSYEGGAILRAEPDPNSAEVAPLYTGLTTQATARLASGDWLRLRLDDGRSGWVRADLVTLVDDVTLLPVVDAGAEPPELVDESAASVEPHDRCERFGLP